MDIGKKTYLDLETVALLRAALDDAWASIPPRRQAVISKTSLAAAVLRTAAQGERDRDRLIDAALDAVAA